MAITLKSDIFGVQPKQLLALLKQETLNFPIELENGGEVLLIQTPYMLVRTFSTPELLVKYPLSKEGFVISRARDTWNKFEGEDAQAVLHLTNVLMEDAGRMARKFVDGDDRAVWIQKSYLDLFGLDVSALQAFMFESIPYYDPRLERCPIRISRRVGYTSGYLMPFVNQREQVYK
jgi:hypothetical protein